MLILYLSYFITTVIIDSKPRYFKQKTHLSMGPDFDLAQIVDVVI